MLAGFSILKALSLRALELFDKKKNFFLNGNISKCLQYLSYFIKRTW